MKVDYLYEAGVFGTYKKASTQSNIENVKKDLARQAATHILEKNCDGLSEVFLNMINEINKEILKISSKYSFDTGSHAMNAEHSELIELSEYVSRAFTMSRKKDAQVNIIKNVYCNKLAIDFMNNFGCVIIPLVDNKRKWSRFSTNSEELIAYKDMTQNVAEAINKIFKNEMSSFPKYASYLPQTVKIVILKNFDSELNPGCYRNQEASAFIASMGISFASATGVEFDYPGQGSSFLEIVSDPRRNISCTCSLGLTKKDEPSWKKLAKPTPWMITNFVSYGVNTTLSELCANNFYGISLLKYALDNNIFCSEIPSVSITMDNVIKNLKNVKEVKDRISSEGLEKIVNYSFGSFFTCSDYTESFNVIGKEISKQDAEKEGIDVNGLKRRIYEFDYTNPSIVKSTAKTIIKGCSRFLTDPDIKKMAEDKLVMFLPVLMEKVLASKPYCVSSSNKILICDYHQKSDKKSNIRAVIDTTKIEINKNNLVFYIAIDFKLPVRGVNPKYTVGSTRQNRGKNYEYITGKKIKIELPLI